MRYFISLLIKRNWYSLRRAYIFPEDHYKRIMLKRVQKQYKCKYFIETGTHKGKTPAYLHKLFEKIFTIELDVDLYMKSHKKLFKFGNIKCLGGDSKNVLSDIIPNIDETSMFWLDGHYSGDGTAKGEISAPLLEELDIISKSNIMDHIIIIDDISDFCLSEDNIQLSKIIDKLESINPKYKFYFDYDMLFALPNEKTHREFWKKIALPVLIR